MFPDIPSENGEERPRELCKSSGGVLGLSFGYIISSARHVFDLDLFLLV